MHRLLRHLYGIHGAAVDARTAATEGRTGLLGGKSAVQTCQ